MTRTINEGSETVGMLARAMISTLIMLMFSGVARAADDDGIQYFEKNVRPILVERCNECHGDSGKVKGGLRLTTREGILKGGESGPAAVPGKPGESLIVEAIRYVDEPRMPPKGKLKDREIDLLTRWITMGLPWPKAEADTAETGGSEAPLPFQITSEQRKFWSFQPVKPVDAPTVKDGSWPRSDIDRFVLARLEGKEMRPAGPASRRVFIRRASYDLTGLAPSPEEIKTFVEDVSPYAFDKLIDRLLASPHYGERWGRYWLDLVRYTDSFDARIAGSNNEMDINESWRYRDWVVGSFNRDLPYDEFLRRQVAGDLSPAGPSDGDLVDGTIATGLLAIGNWGGGDADKEKLLTDIADDQVDVVSRAFMGLTVACARCHDHKFDPISTQDYYGLAGIFFSTHILPNVGPKTNGPPMLKIPIATAAETSARERHAKRAKELETQLSETSNRGKIELAESLLPETDRYLAATMEYADKLSSEHALTTNDFSKSHGLRPYAFRQWAEYLGLVDENPLLATPIRDVQGRRGVLGWIRGPELPSVLVNSNAESVTLLSFTIPARTLAVHPSPDSSVAITWASPIAGDVNVSGRVGDADPSCGDGVGWRLDLRKGIEQKEIRRGEIANGGSADFSGTAEREGLGSIQVRKGDRLRLTVSPLSNHGCDMTNVRLTVNAVSGPARWDLSEDVTPDALAGNPHADRLGNQGVWIFQEVKDPASGGLAGRDGEDVVRRLLTAPRDPEALKASAQELQKSFKKDLKKSPFWVRLPADERELSTGCRESLGRIRAEQAGLVRNPPPPLRFANGAQEGGVPGSPHEGVHDVKVHVRGSYSRLGQIAPRHFPVVVAGETPPRISTGSGRRELADWLTSAQHPLTARVMVNRIWQHHFGAGIVRTPSNFGKLGERPSHPELLDYLARAFVGGGWSIKRMHRAMMLSSVYRQSSETDAESFQADPDNRLFGRMTRRRLEAESIRDSLLAASGRLDGSLGGSSTRDANVPRRTMYLMTIRSDRTSFGPLFDAADPTVMVDTRTISTVAPQALFLLNNGFVLDQARGLAGRLKAERGDELGRIDRGYELLFGRLPTEEERLVGRESLELFAKHGKVDPWAAYCHVLLCTNEWLYID